MVEDGCGVVGLKKGLGDCLIVGGVLVKWWSTLFPF